MKKTFAFDVFLSYSFHDLLSVLQLAEMLKASGLRVWFDKWEILPGDLVGLKIEQGLESSRVLILCMSSHAFQSEWVTLERQTILFRDPTNKQRRFIPCLINECVIPDTLNLYEYIDLRASNPNEIDRLLKVCHWTPTVAAIEDNSKLCDTVARLYLDEGATSVLHQKLIDGVLVDLVVEMKSCAGRIKLAVQCVHDTSKLLTTENIKPLNEFKRLRDSGLVDLVQLISERPILKEVKDGLVRNNIKAYSLDELHSQLLSFHSYIELMFRDISRRPVFCNKWYTPQFALDPIGQRVPLDCYIHNWLRSKSNLLFILGDFGTGKTTYLQALWLQLAERCKVFGYLGPIPLFLRLREMNEASSFRGFITDNLMNQNGIAIRNYLHLSELIKANRFVIMLDGFDEISIHPDQSRIIRDLGSCIESCCGNSKVIITSRPSIFGGEENAKGVIASALKLAPGVASDIINIAKFTSDDIADYVSRRCANHEVMLCTIKTTYNLMDLATRPFLLDLMIQELFVLVKSGQKISPATIYESHINHWVDRDGWRVLATKEQRLFLMEEMATFAHMESKAGFTLVELQDLVRMGFEEIYERTELNDIDNDIRVCSFVDCTRAGMYVFSHRSFAEYFMAKKLCRNAFSEPSKADLLLESRSISKEIEYFALDVAMNVYKVETVQCIRFCFPYSTPIDISKLDEQETLSSEQTKLLCISAIELYQHTVAGAKFRSKLCLLLACVRGDAAIGLRYLLTIGKYEPGKFVSDVINLAQMCGKRELGRLFDHWYSETALNSLSCVLQVYIDNIKSYTQKEKVRALNGRPAPPDERFMRFIEESIGIPEWVEGDYSQGKDVFRRGVMSAIAALAIDGIALDLEKMRHSGGFLESLYDAIHFSQLGFNPKEVWRASEISGDGLESSL